MLQGWMEMQCITDLHHTMATVAIPHKTLKLSIQRSRVKVCERETVSLASIKKDGARLQQTGSETPALHIFLYTYEIHFRRKKAKLPLFYYEYILLLMYLWAVCYFVANIKVIDQATFYIVDL